MLRQWFAAAAALLLATTAQAQDFPKRPITMIVPFTAGGTSDVIARAVADQMSAALGQTIIIENVGGAGGSTALTRAARAEPTVCDSSCVTAMPSSPPPSTPSSPP